MRVERQFQRVEAVFQPRETGNLVAGADALVGQRFEWMAAWVIESGPYEGEWAMQFMGPGTAPFAWAPSGDLQ